jgi:hypothetical protein
LSVSNKRLAKACREDVTDLEDKEIDLPEARIEISGAPQRDAKIGEKEWYLRPNFFGFYSDLWDVTGRRRNEYRNQNRRSGV